MARATSSRAHVARDDRGFSLIESLVASAILLTIAIVVMTTLIATSTWYAKARIRTEAGAVANEVISLILSRNASDIHRPAEGETWPAAIPATMPWPSAVGTFSVETSLVPQVDPATGTHVTEVIVTASPVGQVLDPAVSIMRYVSGWQEKDPGAEKSQVTVEVQLQTDHVSLAQSGVRVQLLDVSTLGETYYAVSNSAGVARFESVTEGQYFLTSDPRFGTDIRPLHFPERVYPTRLGPPGQADAPSVKYSLEVVRQDSPAILSVGAFQTDGFTGGGLVLGVPTWNIEKPYRPVQSASGTKLVIYARPVLNAPGTVSGVVGSGSTYPKESMLGPYSAAVNDYGVAKIVVPWTIDPSLGQSWEVWCSFRDRTTGVLTTHFLLPNGDHASGGWGVPVNQIDLMDQGQRVLLPQFTGLLNVDPVNSP